MMTKHTIAARDTEIGDGSFLGSRNMEGMSPAQFGLITNVKVMPRAKRVIVTHSSGLAATYDPDEAVFVYRPAVAA
jgi:hypothetical protein